MPLDTNGLGLIQNGLEHRGFKVNRLELSGEILITAVGRRNQTVELKVKVLQHNRFWLVTK
jgi:hypothetical protein